MLFDVDRVDQARHIELIVYVDELNQVFVLVSMFVIQRRVKVNLISIVIAWFLVVNLHVVMVLKLLLQIGQKIFVHRQNIDDWGSREKNGDDFDLEFYVKFSRILSRFCQMKYRTLSYKYALFSSCLKHKDSSCIHPSRFPWSIRSFLQGCLHSRLLKLIQPNCNSCR